MEACILVCRKQKEAIRKGKVLFINAVDLIEKRGTEVTLSDEHIKQIADTYLSFSSVDEFSKVIENDVLFAKEL